MAPSEDLSPETLLQHFAEECQPHGAVVPPIYQSSLFTFDKYDDFASAMRDNPAGPPFHYSRISNPSLHTVEQKIAKLERLDRAKLFSTGMGAILAAVMHNVQKGTHVVAADTCYGPVRSMLSGYLSKFGVACTFVDGRTPESVLDAIGPDTSAVYLESPSSLVFRLQNLTAITKGCREKGVVTIMDNTYSTPLYQTPAEMGVEMVVHSGTKYLSGHSDLTAGVVCLSDARFDRFVRDEVAFIGSTLGPFQAWLMLRGMRTLAVRLKHHESSANRVAAWLGTRTEVELVHHVSLSDYPQRELYLRQMRGSAGLFSFVPKRQEDAWVKRFVESLELFHLGVSWGGFESLVVPVQLAGFSSSTSGWAIRLYTGLEDPADLIRDIERAFVAANSAAA